MTAKPFPDPATDPTPGPEDPTGLNAAAGPVLVLRAPAAASALGIGTRKLWSLTNVGEIPHFRIGRAVCYRVADLDAWTVQQVECQRKRGGGR